MNVKRGERKKEKVKKKARKRENFKNCAYRSGTSLE